jgi:Domain of unknown function (DUF6997)
LNINTPKVKAEILTEIWTRVKIAPEPFIFDNELVTKACVGRYRNPHTLTKLDRLDEVPAALAKDDVFIAHLGEGRHRFVKGLNAGFHHFEPQQDPPEERPYTRTLLDELGGGEADMLSRVYNHGLIQLFLYGDDTERTRIRLPGRSSDARDNSFKYTVGNQAIEANQLQVEMDFIVQHDRDVAFAEAKSGTLQNNFAVAQLFMPFLKLRKLGERLNQNFNIRPLFITQYRKEYQSARVPKKKYEHIRFHEYRFSNETAMDSLALAEGKPKLSAVREFVMIPR